MEPIKKILIENNIKSAIEKQESFFNRENIRILTSSSNKEVLSIHKREKADLIITRLDTPQMDGETLCSLIRSDRKLQRVSIIMIYPGTENSIEKHPKCRANAFISEPLDPQILFEKSYQLLNVAQRESLRAPVVIKVQGKYKDEPFLCVTENISASGMLFHTERVIDKGDNVLCSFFLPNSAYILTEAEIVRVVEKKNDFDTYHYGIKFSNINISDKSLIEMFVKEKIQRLEASLDIKKEDGS